MENKVDVKEMLTKKIGELEQVKAQMQQIDQQVAQLQKKKDQFLTSGIELQGMIKILSELQPKEVTTPPVA